MRIHLLTLPFLAACYIGTSRDLGNYQEDTVESGDTDTDSDADSDADTDSDTDADSDPGAPVNYSVEFVKTGLMPDLVLPKDARVASSNNFTYILEAPGASEEAGTIIPYLEDAYVHPEGDWCVNGGTVDKGKCRGGTVWYSGRVVSDKPSQAFCFDQTLGRMFTVKDQGTRLEVTDVGPEGDDAYTYNRPETTIQVPAEMVALGRFLGPCDYLPATDELVLSPQIDGTEPGAGLQIIAASNADGEYRRGADLGFSPGHMYAVANGTKIIVDDPSTNSLFRVDAATLTVDWGYSLSSSIVHFGMNRETGMAYIAHGSGGAGMLDTNDPGATERMVTGVNDDVRWAWADATRGTSWFVSKNGNDVYSAYLEQNGAATSSYTYDKPVVAVAEPGDMGDLVAVQLTSTAGSGSYTVLGAAADKNDGRPPVYIFLFTTIEEPSDTNLTLPCDSSTSTADFANELALVRTNSSMIADLGVPVAMAITDNFAEKSEECGQTGIYREMQELGFELGAMLHNRPCYNCTNGATESNADSCDAQDANYIASTSGAACFPDDPDYCELGDWDCYYRFLQPRAEFADRDIPGGAEFIVGGDRHGMWKYDWIRFYQEVEREHTGTIGYDLTLFAGIWAYNNIDYDDPRGKNPSPWRASDRTGTWRLGDIDHWDRDSAFSDLLYLSGVNSATVKLSEQRHSGMYMADFFDFVSEFQVSYDEEDFDVQWQLLRQAVNYRKQDRLNTYYFHVHDNGTVNLGDASGADVMVTDDEGNPMASKQPLIDFVAKINERYASTGEIVWMYPSDIKDKYNAEQDW